MDDTRIRLTEYSHGGGCGCKISPSQLRDILKHVPLQDPFTHLLVGSETSDDAAVYYLNDQQALVLTTDFFMPIVDDPVDFGRVAATNALSDVYAMGGSPILALAILGMPINTLPLEAIQGIMQGGIQVCQQAGIPLAGGHSIDSPEPIFGLVAAGLVDPKRVCRNATAQPEDILILTKPLGIGVMTTALKKDKLSPEGYTQVLEIMTQLNQVGSKLAPYVNAMTDVTGFGLLGHLLEICHGSNVTAEIEFDRIPILPEARQLAQSNLFPGAARRNWQGYGGVDVTRLQEWEWLLLSDPQTSGGLLLSVPGEGVETVLDILQENQCHWSAVIGKCQVSQDPTRIRVL